MAEDIKKTPEEINEDDLEFVAGGAYTYEEWKAMTQEERKAAQARSQREKSMNRPCELD